MFTQPDALVSLDQLRVTVGYDLGVDCPWAERRHPNSFLPACESRSMGQRQNRMLGRRIGDRHGRISVALGVGRCNIDDPPISCLGEMGERQSDESERRFHIDGPEVIQCLLVSFQKAQRLHQSGIVDERIDPAEPFERRAEPCLRRRRIEGIKTRN